LDCDNDEEASASAGVIIAIDPSNNICGVQKVLSGSITNTDMSIALTHTLTVGSSIFSAIDNVMKLTADRDKMHPDAPSHRMGLLI